MPFEALGLPKPCGARPRSVELPWAAQVRVPLVTRWLETRFELLFCMRKLLPAADGGRFPDRPFCLVKVPPLFGKRFELLFCMRKLLPAADGGRFPDRPFCLVKVPPLFGKRFELLFCMRKLLPAADGGRFPDRPFCLVKVPPL